MVDLSLDSGCLRHKDPPLLPTIVLISPSETHLAHGKERRPTRETAEKKHIELSRVLSQAKDDEPRNPIGPIRCLWCVSFGRGCYAPLTYQDTLCTPRIPIHEQSVTRRIP